MRLWTQRLFKNHSIPSVFSSTSRLHLHRYSSSSVSSESALEASQYTDYPYIQKCCSELAFGFDIDGVLLRGNTPLPGASKTLKFLQQSKIPFVLLTNGGGNTEEERAAELSEILDVPILGNNLIQSHTPFKEFVCGNSTQTALENKTILVIGGRGDKCRQVALKYGFKNVLTTADILMGYKKIWPFNQIFLSYYESNHCPLPLPINLEDLSKSLKIDAILVLNDPRDWALDIQIIIDLLLSHKGYLGTYSSKNGDTRLPNCGWQQDEQPKLYFSNPDLFWAASYHLPRLGQGGFQAALHGVWNATTKNAQLNRKILGKPCNLAYSYAEQVLLLNRSRILGSDAPGLKKVWFVGDNQFTDIKGANEFQSQHGIQWQSILVTTGVYKAGSALEHKPKLTVFDVQEAVKSVVDAQLAKA